MKKLFFSFIFCLLISVQAFAQTKDVYVGGADNSKATVWKNETPTYLSERESGVYAIVVVDDDVYATGWEKNALGVLVAKVWKNDTEMYSFGDGTMQNHAYSIAVLGSDVYTAGYEASDEEYGFSIKGKVWKNGVAESGYADAYDLRSVFIDGNDVYVAGTTTAPYNAAIWKNGVLLYTFEPGAATSVVVANGDVYAAGFEFDEVNYAYIDKIWKNGEMFYLFESGEMQSALFISNGIIYTTGSSGNTDPRIPTLWVDGVATYLTNVLLGSYMYGTSVFVSGNDVYVAMTDNNRRAFLWVNGTVTTLAIRTQDTTNFSFANSVFVVDNSGAGIGSAGAENAQPVGYYSILGVKLPQEPESELYIILYDNGKAEKVIKN